MNKSMQFILPSITKKTLHIGIAGFNFSNRLIAKYIIFKKSINLPALIFLRLFGTGIVNKVTNTYRTELTHNHYRLYLNLYFKTISRLEQMLSHHNQYNQSQNYFYHVDYIKTQPAAGGLSNYASYFKNVSLYLKNIFQQHLYVRSGDTCSRNEIDSSRQVGIRNDRSEGLAMTYKKKLPMIQLLSQVSQFLKNAALMGRVTMRSPLPSVLNTPHPTFLKGDESGLYSRQGAIFSSGMLSMSYKYSEFLNHNVLKNAMHIQIFKPYIKTARGKAISKSGSETLVSKIDIKENENIITLPLIPSCQRRGSKGSFSFVGEGGGSGVSLEHNLYFHNQRGMEQKFEDIKKIVVETKEAVRETSFSNYFQNDMDKAIKQHLDINRISDQVYQKIERRIRIERERKGI